MFSNKKSEALLAKIREGAPLMGREKLRLIVELSIPSILAQITSVLMFYIDASMVGSLGTEASAAIGLVEPASWLFGSLTGAASMGFAVQVAHFIGANDFRQARRVMKHGYLFCFVFSLVLMAVACGVSGPGLFLHLFVGRSFLHDGEPLFCHAQVERRHAASELHCRVGVCT